MIQDLTRDDFQSFIEQSINQPVVLYFQTPLCGTCKMGRKMLEICLETFKQTGKPIVIGACNLNLMPELSQTYSITTVPSLVILNRGIIVQKIDALKSVDYLYETLKKYV